MGRTFRGTDRKEKLKFKEQRKVKHKRSLDFELNPPKKDRKDDSSGQNTWH